MLDFMTVATKYSDKDKITEVFPKFIMQKSKDLMIRGRDFYAICTTGRSCYEQLGTR